MNNVKKLLTIGAIMLLAGCAAGAQTENMVVSKPDAVAVSYDKALQQNVAVGTVEGGKKTNPAWTSEIGNEEFSAALQSSLQARDMFAEDGRYHLTANLLKVEQPLIGISLTVTTHVEYTLTDSKTGKALISKTLVTPHTATMGDAVLAVKRLQIANEGAGKKNIEALIQELSALSITGQKIAVK